MVFRPLRLEDRAWITACRDVNEHPFTALSFASLYSWRVNYGFTVTGDRDFFVIHSEHDGAYYCPCGSAEKCRTFIDALEGPAKLLYLTDTQARALEGRGWSVRHRADLSEYILSTAAQALRAGHVSKSFRDKCHHFKNRFVYSTHAIGPEDLPFLRASLQEIRDDAREGAIDDFDVLSALIENYDTLALRGVLLESGQTDFAYILGYENTPDSFTVSIGKHSPGLPPETPVVMIHELALMLDGEYPLLNLEEDLGLEGLRRAKELQSPVAHLEVYEAVHAE